jgi:DNA repair protein RadC
MDNGKTHKGKGHRQRLRDRFLAAGLDGFHDYEVIELLLTLGTPRKDCKDAAKAALSRFKSLQGVIEASPEELCEVKGLGTKNIIGIKMIRAVAERYLKKKLIGKDLISNSKELFDYLYHSLRDKQRESFNAVFMDSKNRVISTETLSTGTLTASSVYPREVVHAALNHHAAAIIFAHNHPSGDPHPSQEDVAITRQLVFAGRVMGITVHEHIIIGDNRYFSFADQGHINQMTREYDTMVQPNADPVT